MVFYKKKSNLYSLSQSVEEKYSSSIERERKARLILKICMWRRPIIDRTCNRHSVSWNASVYSYLFRVFQVQVWVLSKLTFSIEMADEGSEMHQREGRPSTTGQWCRRPTMNATISSSYWRNKYILHISNINQNVLILFDHTRHTCFSHLSPRGKLLTETLNNFQFQELLITEICMCLGRDTET